MILPGTVRQHVDLSPINLAHYSFHNKVTAIVKNIIHTLAGGSRIAFLLVSIFLLTIVYPLAARGTTTALFLAALYLSVLASAVYLVSSDRVLLIINIALSIVIGMSAVLNVINEPDVPVWLLLTWNATMLAQQVFILALLLIFIIQSVAVTRDVLYAAVTIYFFIAAIFSVLYQIIEIISPGAFVSSFDLEITAERLTYFSFVTITTLGYGDIVPIDPAAQSLATLEATIGTLYIAVLLGRFVSLYQPQNP